MVVIPELTFTADFRDHVVHTNINGVGVTVTHVCVIRGVAQFVKVFVNLTLNPLNSQLPEHGDRAGVSNIEVTEMFVTQRTIKGVDTDFTVKLCGVRLCDFLLTHFLHGFKHLLRQSFQYSF